MKLLVVIANYGTNQLSHLDKVLYEYKNYKNIDVDIIVHTNETISNNVNQILIKNLDNWNRLPFTTRKTIFDRKDDYDLFIYSENDHLITENNVKSFLNVTHILPEKYKLFL